MPLISFDGISQPLEEVQNNPARFALHLERAKKNPGYAVCGCKPSSILAPLRLVVRRYGKLFHLARWPDEGAKHDATTCPFFAKPGPLGAFARLTNPFNPDLRNQSCNYSTDVLKTGAALHSSACPRPSPLRFSTDALPASSGQLLLPSYAFPQFMN